MKITSDAETNTSAPYNLTLQLRGNPNGLGPPCDISVNFDQHPLTKEEEEELSAWLLKFQRRIHSIERPPFASQSVAGTPTDAPSKLYPSIPRTLHTE